MLEPTVAAEVAASLIFNLPDYRVTGTVLLPDGARHITVETTFPPGCPSCGVIACRVKERRCQRLRDIPVAGTVVLLWDKRRWFCDEYLCERKSFCEATPQVPGRARSTRRLRQTVLDAVITSGRAVSETAMAFGISWWLVQQVIGQAALRLPDVDLLTPRMLGIDEHRYRSVRFFQDPGTKAWTRYEPWMTTIVDLDTGQVLGIVDGRDHKGVGEWLFARPLDWRLAVQVVAIDPSAAFEEGAADVIAANGGLGGSLPRDDAGNDMLTTVRQGLSQQVRGRRGRATEPAWANRLFKGSRGTLKSRLLLRTQQANTRAEHLPPG